MKNILAFGLFIFLGSSLKAQFGWRVKDFELTVVSTKFIEKEGLNELTVNYEVGNKRNKDYDRMDRNSFGLIFINATVYFKNGKKVNGQIGQVNQISANSSVYGSNNVTIGKYNNDDIKEIKLSISNQ